MASNPKLADWLQAGRYLDILFSDPANDLIAEFGCSLAVQRQGLDEQKEGISTSTSDVRDRVTVGQAALNAFLQANVTGPVLEARRLRSLEKLFLGASPWAKSARDVNRACRRGLAVDGVEVYEHVPLVDLFCLARFLLLQDDARSTRSEPMTAVERLVAWLALRVNVWHYKLLTQPILGSGSAFNKSGSWCDVPSLQGQIEKGMDEVEAELFAAERWSTHERAQFLVEKANVCIMLGQDVKAREAVRKAAELSGFVYALSGALGKRTRFQQTSTSQLVVLARSREETRAGEDKNGEARPVALALNDDTLLENLEFTTEKGDEVKQESSSELPAALRELSPDEQPQLSPVDQIVLLAEATLKDAFSPADSLTSEEIFPFAVRVISDKSTNWQIYTHALLVRSRIEVHRSRTVERGVLQMQAVVDQVVVDTTQSAGDGKPEPDGNSSVPEIQITSEAGEGRKSVQKPTSFFPVAKPTEAAPAQDRLEYIHAISSPPRWHLESELAYAWAGVGSLVSALEIFKRLRLWAEVALCFAASAARDDEDGRGSSGEAKAKAVLRWRLFRRTGAAVGEQDGTDDTDEDADFDALKEADYHGPERQPSPPNAPRLWCILGELENEPAHYERAWEVSKHRFARAQKSLGEYFLQQKDLRRAKGAYQKAVAVNRLSTELWNRLGDISLRLGDFSDAAEAFGRAIATADNIVGGEDARTWSNLGSALYSLYMERVKELKQQKEQARADDGPASPLQPAADDDEDDEGPSTTTSPANPPPRDPSTLLAQSLAAYKRGAHIARDNWRIWDNVVTLAARLRPPPVPDLLVALRHVARIRRSEDALDVDVLRLLVNEALLAHERPPPPPAPRAAAAAGAVDDLPRGTPQRAVCEFVEDVVVPLVTVRSELWELVTRERVWRGDHAGAIDAAERAWRAAVGGVTGAAASGGLLPASAAGGGRNWLEDEEGWKTVVDRTDELVSMLENYGGDVAEIGTRWKGKARSAVRSVMGKAKENWEGSEGWQRLEALLEGLA